MVYNVYIPKKYGQSRIDKCPFCSNHATTQNEQSVPVCSQHKNTTIERWKCVCGEHLDLMQGKFGPYFVCLNCGNISFSKALEVNEGNLQTKERTIPRESTFRSDEIE
jgi:hypothetical protein